MRQQPFRSLGAASAITLITECEPTLRTPPKGACRLGKDVVTSLHDLKLRATTGTGASRANAPPTAGPDAPLASHTKTTSYKKRL